MKLRLPLLLITIFSNASECTIRHEYIFKLARCIQEYDHLIHAGVQIGRTNYKLNQNHINQELCQLLEFAKINVLAQPILLKEILKTSKELGRILSFNLEHSKTSEEYRIAQSRVKTENLQGINSALHEQAEINNAINADITQRISRFQQLIGIHYTAINNLVNDLIKSNYIKIGNMTSLQDRLQSFIAKDLSGFTYFDSEGLEKLERILLPVLKSTNAVISFSTNKELLELSQLCNELMQLFTT